MPRLVLPAYLSAVPNDAGLRRLLDGQPPSVVAGTTVPGVRALGDVPVEEIALADLQAQRDETKHAVGRAKVLSAAARDRQLASDDAAHYGHGAANNVVEVTRAVFGQLTQRGWCRHNPALGLRKLPTVSPRRGLSPTEIDTLRDWVLVARTDVVLDLLLIDLFLHTGARLSGLIAITVESIDAMGCFLVTEQKNNKFHRNPVRRSVLLRTLRLGSVRGASAPEDLVLRRRNGAPVTKKYVDGLFRDVQTDGPFTRELQISAHWMRHTTLTWLDATAGVRVAHGWANHSPKARGTLGSYVGKASPAEFVRASKKVFGPLEDTPYDPGDPLAIDPLTGLTIPKKTRRRLDEALDEGRGKSRREDQ